MSNLRDKIKELEKLAERYSDKHKRERSEYQRTYDDLRLQFENKKFTTVATGAKELLKKLLADILMAQFFELTQGIKGFSKDLEARLNPDRELSEDSSESESDAHRSIVDLPLIQLTEIFDNNKDLFQKAGDDYEKLDSLLASFKYGAFCKIFDEVDENKGKESALTELGLQQVLCAIAALLVAHDDMPVTPRQLLANFSDMTKEVKRIRNLQSKVDTVTSDLSYLTGEEDEEQVRKFNWYKKQGMLINPSDGSRNVAFKVETFAKILETIYIGIMKTCRRDECDHEKKNKCTNADKILFNAGLSSGSAFGWTMHEKLLTELKYLDESANRREVKDGEQPDGSTESKDFTEQESGGTTSEADASDKEDELESKIKSWCDFDSDVGFGKLELLGEIVLSQEHKKSKTDQLSLVIRLSNNFAVFKMERRNVNVCSFVMGYIKGVLEKVTGQPLEVTHEKSQCEQMVPGQYHCDFTVKSEPDETDENESTPEAFDPNDPALKTSSKKQQAKKSS